MTTKTHIDRRALFASGAAAALLAATGVSAGPAPGRGGRLRIAMSGASRSDTFDFRRAALGTQEEPGLFMKVAMVGVLFDTLTEIAADGTLRGELATGWRSNADGSRWEFDLRQGVQFHDGQDFTADDVRQSFAPLRENLLRDVTQIDATNRHRLVVDLKAGDPHFPMRLSQPQTIILPLGEGKSFAEGIGTGLYRLHKFQPGRDLLAHRVEQHYKDGRAGWFNTIELVSLPSDEVRAEALRDHYVDAADLTHTADLGDLENITLLPKQDFMTAAVDDCVALPGQIGNRWPLDNLRAPERWWMA